MSSSYLELLIRQGPHGVGDWAWGMLTPDEREEAVRREQIWGGCGARYVWARLNGAAGLTPAMAAMVEDSWPDMNDCVDMARALEQQAQDLPQWLGKAPLKLAGALRAQLERIAARPWYVSAIDVHQLRADGWELALGAAGYRQAGRLGNARVLDVALVLRFHAAELLEQRTALLAQRTAARGGT